MTLKVGVIGLGVGEAHAEAFHANSACELVKVCDFSEDKLKQARAKFPGIKTCTLDEEILGDPELDIVAVASYENYHFDQIARALRGGKHVFAEKPFCLYKDEARAIRSLLQQDPNLTFSSNLILRKCPRFLRLKQLIDAGDLGALYFLEGDYNYGRLHKIVDGWRGDLEYYSVVYGGAVHIVDLLLWLSGDRIGEVTAYGNNICSRGTKFKFNDMVVAAVRFSSGAVGKIGANFGCVRPHFHALNIYGTKATFINGEESAELFRSSEAKASPEAIHDAYPGVHKGALIDSFIDEILGRGKALVSAEDTFRSMSVCFAIEESVQAREKIAVEYL